MEANQTKANGGAASSKEKEIRQATEEEKRFAQHIKSLNTNIFKTIVYYI
jgi:hypothetical protein